MAATQDFVPALFKDDVYGLPGTHRPRDTYGWLEDSDDESDLITTKARVAPRTQIRFDAFSGSPNSWLDPKNANGKRALHINTYNSVDESWKRMRAGDKASKFATSKDQVEPKRPHTTVDLSVSSPLLRSTRYAPDHQSEQSRHRSPRIHHSLMPASNLLANIPKPQSSHQPEVSARAPHSPPQMAQPSASGSLLHHTPPESPTAIESENVHTMRITAPTANGPFEIDNDSDDETHIKSGSTPVESSLEKNRTPSWTKNSAKLRPSSQMNAGQKELQLAKSRKRRQESAKKKTDALYQSSTSEGVDLEFSTDTETRPSCSIVQGADKVQIANNRILDPRLRNRQKHALSATGAVVDSTGSDDTNGSPIGYLPSRTFDSLKALGAQPKPHQGQAMHQKGDGMHSMLDDRALGDENPHKAAEPLMLTGTREQQHADFITEREQMRHLEKKRTEEADRAAIAEARKRFEAQKKLDDEKEAGARVEEERKRHLQQAQWEERRAAQEQQREMLRRKSAEAEKESVVHSEREAALAKLSAIHPPQPTKKPLPSGETNINDVVGKFTLSHGLDFKDWGDVSITASAARKKVKEIQEKHKHSGLYEAKDKKQDSMSDRDKRSKAMVERNLRMREAEAKERAASEVIRESYDQKETMQNAKPYSEAQRHDSRAPTPELPFLPQGPQSLSSAAGQALLARASKAKDTKQSVSARPKRRNLGEILPEDTQLVRWRDTGMRFQDIALLWPQTFGTSKAIDTIRHRYKTVKEALKMHGLDVEPALLDGVIIGQKEARAELNRRVHGEWPLPGTAPKTRDAKGHVVPTEERESTAKPRHRTTDPKLTQSFDPSTTEGTLAHKDNEAVLRPTVAGKTMNAQTFQYYLEMLAEVTRAEEEEEDAYAHEDSPITEEDYCHFDYQVQRREISEEDLHDGFDLEEDPWQILDEPLDILADANAKAANEALTIPKKWKARADSSLDHDYKARTMDDGCKMFTVTWTGVCRVQTRVVRLVRYYQDGVLPTSKDGWAPKTIWHVRKHEIIKTGIEDSDDELFAEKNVIDKVTSIDNAVYTTLEQANFEAIKHFISITFTPKSGHLTQRAIEIKAAEKKLEEELSEEEGPDEDRPSFEREIDSDAGRWVKVWVEKGELRGPRNL